MQLNSYKEALEISKTLVNWFLDVRKEYPDTILTQNGDSYDIMFYFKGNKTTGNDFELNGWKELPIFKCRIRQYSDSHPSKSGEYYLDCRLAFCGGMSSEDYKLNEADFKKKVRLSFTGAKENFIEKII